MTQFERLSALLINELDEFKKDIHKLNVERAEINKLLNQYAQALSFFKGLVNQLQETQIKPDLTEINGLEKIVNRSALKFRESVFKASADASKQFLETKSKRLIYHKIVIGLLALGTVANVILDYNSRSELKDDIKSEYKKVIMYRDHYDAFLSDNPKAQKIYNNWIKKKNE